MKTLITVEQLCECIHKSVSSIRSDATRNPESLLLFAAPRHQRLFWRIDDVERWLEDHETAQVSANRSEILLRGSQGP